MRAPLDSVACLVTRLMLDSAVASFDFDTSMSSLKVG